MCGIVGVLYFDRERTVAATDVRAMADAIQHRGPDDEGFFVEGRIGLGMRRLSIIDVGGGHQPIFTPDGRYVIVFNGEVYNFAEERRALQAQGHAFATVSDTEVVLHLYAEYGLDFTTHLNGMYGLAIWDRRDQTLVLVRDRIGIKPLYYHLDEDRVVFASEIKSLLRFPGVERALDPGALGEYLRYGFTPGPATLFRGIRKVPMATALVFRERVPRFHEYWRISYRDKFDAGEAELKERLYALVEECVRSQMVADVPIGAFLSGGFDSSSIVYLMSRHATGAVNTYSVGFGRGFEQYNELDAATRFAREFGTNQHEILAEPDVASLLPKLVFALDEPVADSSFLVTYLVARLARESAKVILSGVGGDEIFGGYRRYLNVSLAGYSRFIPGVLRDGLIRPLLGLLPADRNGRIANGVRLARSYLEVARLPLGEQYATYTRVFAPGALGPATSSDAHDRFQTLAAQCDSDEMLDRLMYFDLRMSLPEQLLMLTDKMTMAASLEARVPLLDHRLVEFAARLPARLKVNGFRLRYLQKAAFVGRLPQYVYEQKKKGFGAPVGVWLRHELRPMVEELLGESHLREQGLFDPAAVRRIWQQHLNRSADFTDQLWALLVFQLWSRVMLTASSSVRLDARRGTG